MDEEQQQQDNAIDRWAVEAQKHPPQSKERQLALTQLMKAIQTSGRLSRPRQGEFPHIYEEIYAEALALLWLFVCEKIDRYDPNRATVMQWVNYHLNVRFFIEAIRTVLGTIPRTGIENMDNLPNPETESYPAREILNYIREDPDRRFNAKHVKDRPSVNFLKLLEYRLAGKRWKEMAVDLDVPPSTLSDFYQRCLKEFTPILRDYFSP